MKRSMLVLLGLLCAMPAGAAAAGRSCSKDTRALCGDALALGFAEAEDGEEETAAEAVEGEAENAGEEAEEEETEEGEEAAASGAPGHRRKDSHRRGQPVEISDLALTATGRAALRRHRPTPASVGFSFTLSAASTVSVTIATANGSSGHVAWRPSTRFTVTGRRGSNLVHMHGSGALVPGQDRLTLVPRDGRRSAIVFRVR